MSTAYTECYLPLFEQDLLEIITYLSINLQNREAAEKFVNKVEAAIKERLKAPLAFEPFPSRLHRPNPYYRIYVDNYTIYYVVIGNTMEIRRLLYSPRATQNLL